MDHAALLLLKFGMRRREFLERMKAEVEAGRIIIVGWFEQNASLSSARIVVGGDNGESLAGIIDAVEKLSLR